MALQVELEEVEESARDEGAHEEASSALHHPLQRDNQPHGGRDLLSAVASERRKREAQAIVAG